MANGLQTDEPTVSDLLAQLRERDARIAELTEALARLADRLEELLAVVGRQASARQAKKEAESAPPPPPELDDEARVAYANRPKPPEPKPKPEKTPKKRAQASRSASTACPGPTRATSMPAVTYDSCVLAERPRSCMSAMNRERSAVMVSS